MVGFDAVFGGLGVIIFDFVFCWEASMNQCMSMRNRRNMWQTLRGCTSTTHGRLRSLARLAVISAIFAIFALAAGCQMPRGSNPAEIGGGATVRAVDMDSSL